jgi:hypothetical protein
LAHLLRIEQAAQESILVVSSPQKRIRKPGRKVSPCKRWNEHSLRGPNPHSSPARKQNAEVRQTKRPWQKDGGKNIRTEILQNEQERKY